MTDNQLPLSFVAPITGREAKRIGIKKVETTADALDETWRERAYEFLKSYIKYRHQTFLTEDVRLASMETLGDAPGSKRIWGSIISRAAREGLIVRAGYGTVKNVTAHAATASRWMVKY